MAIKELSEEGHEVIGKGKITGGINFILEKINCLECLTIQPK